MSDPSNIEPSSSQRVDILDLAILVAKHKRIVLGLPFLIAVLTAGLSLLLPNIYTSTSRILPPQQQPSLSTALLSQFGPAGAGLASSALGLKNPADLYVGMLKSRTVADALIARFGLKDLYGKDTLVETRRALEKVTDIVAGKDGIIAVSVDDEDPKRAADIANAYVDELDKLTQSIAVTEAAQRRLFFERQLKTAKDNLADAEIEMRKAQEVSGLIQPDSQAQAVITAIAGLRAQVIAKEVEVSAMRQFATAHNPEYVRARQQLVSLKNELAGLQRKHNVDLDGGVILPSGNIPELGLQYLRKLRDVKYNETLFELLAKQFELAKIDESKDAVVVQTIDRAQPTDRKSRPMRALLTLIAGAITLLFTFGFVVLRDITERARLSPEYSSRLEALRSYLRLR